jgi:hypothetical protein
MEERDERAKKKEEGGVANRTVEARSRLVV